MTTSTTPAIPAVTSRRRGGAPAYLDSKPGSTDSDDMSRTSRGGCRACRALVARVNNAKHDRDKEKRSGRGEQQAADHRAAERRILLAAFAERERHRQHADDHCERGHQ